MTTVTDSLSMLKSTWTGDASAAFDSALRSWVDDCQVIVQKLGEMIEVTNGNRQIITAGEQCNVDHASRIPVGPGLNGMDGAQQFSMRPPPPADWASHFESHLPPVEGTAPLQHHLRAPFASGEGVEAGQKFDTQGQTQVPVSEAVQIGQRIDVPFGTFSGPEAE